jgi:hypothetical protein
MTDRIERDPHPGLVDRIADALFPWLVELREAAAERQAEAPEREAEAGL